MRACIAALNFCAAVTLFGDGPAHATAEYDYKPDEYVVIDQGRSPDGKFSIAAHGEGAGGSENFHLWLVLEPAHHKAAMLPGIVSATILDSAASAFYGRWASDSRHVAVLHRISRHDVVMDLYAIGDGSVQAVPGPSLLEQVTRVPVDDLDENRRLSEWTDITWSGPATFTIKEHRLYRTTRDLKGVLGDFARQSANGDVFGKPGGELSVEFSAEAQGEIVGDHYRVRNLKPGKFKDLR